MDNYERVFVLAMVVVGFVAGTFVGRFGRSASWEAGLALGATVAAVAGFAAWRGFRK